MSESINRRPSQSPLLLIGIVLTLLAVVGHAYLPERRLTLDSSIEGAYFLVAEGYGPPPEMQWMDQSKLHFACQFPHEPVHQGCAFAFALSPIPSQGVDLSRYKTLHLSVKYTGNAQYLRVAIRNHDKRFSKADDLNSPKFNFVNIPTKDLDRPITINLSEFAVAEWWTRAYNLPREYSHPDLSNATVINTDLQGELAGSHHDIEILQLEFVGPWIIAEYWYLGILCLWMVLGVVYVASQWMRMRRKHQWQREKILDLESEKELYQKLSTTDALTNVLNRAGISQFVAALGITRVAASVIVIDLDHFKRINDERGHAVGDRVLRTLGSVLSASTRNNDAVGRWGGEEFVLVCPGASLANAADLAEKLRHKIMETNFIPEEPLPVTASFGVATSKDAEGFEDAFRQADLALYQAKNRGRNCVVCANEDVMHKVTGSRKGALAIASGRFKLLK